jgi:acetyltransferase-like isoleucine patch superfamily enzyme
VEGYLRAASEADMEILFEWANEPLVRQNSFSVKEISYDEHKKWFTRLLKDPHQKQYMYIQDGEAIGQARICLDGAKAKISYSICADKRKMGYGKRILWEVCRLAKQDFPWVETFVGEVKPENTASQKAFLSAGFLEKSYTYEARANQWEAGLSEERGVHMGNFLSEEELKNLGLKAYGKDVLIGRHAVLYSPQSLSVGNHVRIDDFTIISGNVTLGDYIHVSQFCGLYGGEAGIEMEDFSGLSSKCSVYAVSDDYTGGSMTNPMVPLAYRPGMISRPVRIRKHAVIGCNSVVLPGVVVEEGTSVGSMTLCNKSTEPWSVYMGIPARRTGERKKEILNLEQQFLEDMKNG